MCCKLLIRRLVWFVAKQQATRRRFTATWDEMATKISGHSQEMTSCAPPPAASLDARADEIVERIQPNAQSERSRREVFQYIKRMVESTGAQVSFKIFQSVITGVSKTKAPVSHGNPPRTTPGWRWR